MFEFSKGSVRMQHLVSSPLEEFATYSLCVNPEVSARELKLPIFGTLDIDHLDPDSLKLQRLAAKGLDDKKVKSLQMKYITIPDQYLSYFPDAIAVSDDEAELAVVPAPAVEVVPAAAGADEVAEAARRKRARARDPVAPGARKKPGPKSRNALPAGTASIMTFYSKK